MKYWIVFILFINSFAINSQSFTANLEIKDLMIQKSNFTAFTNIDPSSNKAQDPSRFTEFFLVPEKIKLDTIYPFLSFSAAWYETNGMEDHSKLYIRFSKNETAWDEWIEFKKDMHYERTRYTAVSELMFTHNDYRYYQLRVLSNLNFDGLNVHAIQLNFFSPGGVSKFCGSPLQPSKGLRSQNSCSCMQPKYITRKEWNCLQDTWGVSPTEVSHIIIHHSAGLNESTDWAATVLSIWIYHTVTNGYSDIGYHWLIAPDGTIFEGRYSNGKDVLGAHFCSKNSNTLGICMLGTYSDQSITSKARASLNQLLAWKSCNLNLDPLATSFHHSSEFELTTISGHRQGCATECPGEKLFNELPIIRNEVKSIINNSCFTTESKSEVSALELNCYPNPSENGITIEGKVNKSSTMQYYIFTVDGRLVFQSPSVLVQNHFSQQLTLWLSLSPGWYNLVVKIDGKPLHRKILKS